ncbi:hypothetical protein A9Q98_14575 [Thalassotalea sp. 42_200_T64]|nr:hypothetical protein A9Q98_14575 [Thalassotalea sp. 42_200_T64]
MKYLLVMVTSIVLLSCSNVRFDSNMGPFIRAEISSSVVEQYTMQEIRHYQGDFISSVHSEVCLSNTEGDGESITRPVHFSASARSHLIRELQVNTQLQGGNSLVVHSCNVRANAECYQIQECNGSAYWVDQGKS